MKYLRPVMLILLAVLVINSCKEEEKKKEEVLRPVSYQTVGTSNDQKIRSFSGVAKAGDEIELSFRSGGIITELNVAVGQKVKKGDLIAKLDNVQANLAYEQSVSALNSANSAMKTAKSALERTKSLYESGSQSLSEYESAKNNYQSALDQYESAKRNKRIQQSQISYGYITAPKDGTIANKPGTLNANVSAGQTIAVLNAGEQINIVVGLPENVINKIETNMEVTVSLSSLDGKFKGNVIEVSPVVDSNSSTYPVKIDITAANTQVKPGMAANVTFNFGKLDGTYENTLIIPIKAVGEDNGGNFVFVIHTNDDKTGTVKKQKIELGEMTSNGFKIKSGLNSGEKIAIAGLQTLLDGQKVRLK
ncbi:efflux RND transporter periplasmic adaptor subunit [uncultured Aquimarina sp.]|uniref:efflux RND transporter periplasmic adaptor subunit n=1 Tax=uncultured Aquimarina sp. TaxID=575652 RepID=UPI002607C0F9|nr:efflux RND transporter periplasmic adaptor subunit [uncultured Aquimarina sp.]